MNQTYKETFPKKDVTEDQVRALCDETRKKVVGCQSCSYAADGDNWVVTTVVKMLS